MNNSRKFLTQALFATLRYHGFDPHDIPGPRKRVTIIKDGRPEICWRRTGPKDWVTFSTGQGDSGPADWNAPLNIEQGGHPFICLAVEGKDAEKPDVYLIPLARVVADVKEAYRLYAEERSIPTKTNLRQICFADPIEGGKENHLRGFGRRYAEFLLEPPPAEIEVERGIELGSSAADFRQDKYGQICQKFVDATKTEFGAYDVKLTLELKLRAGMVTFVYPQEPL